MKYKKRFSHDGSGEFSIGRFYNTDVRKFCALTNYHRRFFSDDEAENPQEFMLKAVRDEKMLFFSTKRVREVIGYGYYRLLDSQRLLLLNFCKKPEPFNVGQLIRLCSCIVAFGFEELSGRKIMIVTPEPKLSRALQWVGFELEGVLREGGIFQTKPTDVEVLGLLEKEWKNG